LKRAFSSMELTVIMGGLILIAIVLGYLLAGFVSTL
jgi:hypothetical protein